MPKHPLFLFRATGLAIGLLALAACSPKFDWREVRGDDASFSVMLPAKPARLSREIDLGGTRVNMTMTAAEVDGITFAVGSATLPDAAAATKALSSMKAALVRNINGTIEREASAAPGAPPVIELEALGATQPAGGQPARRMIARLVAKETRVYQVLVVGPADKIPRDQVDTFLTSFEPN